MKIKFVKVNNKIIAITRYAGETLRAYAKCNPEDNFNEELGEKLATARLKIKLAKRRMAWAKKQTMKADAEVNRARNRLNKMRDYLDDTYIEYMEAKKNLKKLEESI